MFLKDIRKKNRKGKNDDSLIIKKDKTEVPIFIIYKKQSQRILQECSVILIIINKFFVAYIAVPSTILQYLTLYV